ncbi:MAG: 2,3-bisphosphoglycerate-independent phosphoglycerate mutase [Chloroflexi bacterium]|nr:2,3-bisphosphoglycerate-independent phosphoglycerate mutase [Chloroflexota bacterium]OJW04168.1 MAG: phosphoglycerate mutase (2,3-diphosphoglycerate-independent) [Chloroflexi bacterium 54-19]
MSNRPKPVVLIVLDGWGYSKNSLGNAIQGHSPNLERYFEEYPHTFLKTSGEAVGLPEGQMGNSEVGHMNLGAGFVVYQQFVKIDVAIRDGSFFHNPALTAAIDHAKKTGGNLHLMGLTGTGGVHAHSRHLYALLKLAHDAGLGAERVFIHAFMDGRDTSPTSGKDFIADLESQLSEWGGRIATVSGRYYAMDRDNRWDRVEKAYRAITEGVGNKAPSAGQALADSYAANVTDEFVVPTVITQADGQPTGVAKDGDSIIFYNFRADRARELTKAFVLPDDKFGAFTLPDGKPAGFARDHQLQNLYFTTMTEYQQGLPVEVAFESTDVNSPIARVVSDAGLHQLHIAETEKYAHVTFFFNGGREQPFPNEDRVLIPSPKVATYDLKPEMSATEVTSNLLERINQDIYDFIIVNYANFDMVGHTGILQAAINGGSVVDDCVRQVVEAVLARGGNLIITADHGNAEVMIDPVTGGPFTEHTTTPVECILVTPEDSPYRHANLKGGILANIAPTLLQLMQLPKAPEMTEGSLIEA